MKTLFYNLGTMKIFKNIFQAFCNSLGGYLVQLETPEENEFIKNYTRKLHEGQSKWALLLSQITAKAISWHMPPSKTDQSALLHR